MFCACVFIKWYSIFWASKAHTCKSGESGIVVLVASQASTHRMTGIKAQVVCTADRWCGACVTVVTDVTKGSLVLTEVARHWLPSAGGAVQVVQCRWHSAAGTVQVAQRRWHSAGGAVQQAQRKWHRKKRGGVESTLCGLTESQTSRVWAGHRHCGTRRDLAFWVLFSGGPCMK